jgi:hypothetical protein
VGPREGERPRVVRLEVPRVRGAVAAQRKGGIIFAVAAAHVSTVGERARYRRGSDREASAARLQPQSWG